LALDDLELHALDFVVEEGVERHCDGCGDVVMTGGYGAEL
jgi:hypothetical protein